MKPAISSAMPKTPRAPARSTAPDDPDVFTPDDLTEDEVRQAEVGDLITISGEQFENVRWSISRHLTRAEMVGENVSQTAEWVMDHVGPISGGDMVPLI